jgi:hypothetical protein
MGVLAKTDQVDARTLRDFADVLARHQDRAKPLELTRYGKPPGPGWRYTIHFRQSGPGVPPLAPG